MSCSQLTIACRLKNINTTIVYVHWKRVLDAYACIKLLKGPVKGQRNKYKRHSCTFVENKNVGFIFLGFFF